MVRAKRMRERRRGCCYRAQPVYIYTYIYKRGKKRRRGGEREGSGGREKKRGRGIYPAAAAEAAAMCACMREREERERKKRVLSLSRRIVLAPREDAREQERRSLRLGCVYICALRGDLSGDRDLFIAPYPRTQLVLPVSLFSRLYIADRDRR